MNTLNSIISSAELVLSKSGFHQRFKECSVQFLKDQLERVLAFAVESSKSLDALKDFKRVIIFDSSGWNLNKKLKKVYKGSGGSASPAGCKIQCGFDIKSSTFALLDITQGNEPDQKYVKNVPDVIQKGDLFLADLGYFCLRTLKRIAESYAYYLLRYLSSTNLYIKDKHNSVKKLDLLKLLKKSSNTFELEVLTGTEVMLNSRLVCYKLSPTDASQKLRRLNKNAKKRGRCISKSEKILAKWEIFITNINNDSLSSCQLAELYKLRWTIELIFKQFKSTLDIHVWNHSNKFRLECEIIGTLIIAAIIFLFQNNAQILTLKSHQKEISIEKIFKHLKNSGHLLLQLINSSKSSMTKILHKIFDSILKFCLKESRSSRPSSWCPFLKNYAH